MRSLDLEPFDDQIPCDAGQTSFGNRWGEDPPSITTKTLLPVPTKGCPRGSQDRLAEPVCSSFSQAHGVLGVRRRLQAHQRRPFVARPTTDHHLRCSGPGSALEADTRGVEARRHVETPVDRVQTCR